MAKDHKFLDDISTRNMLYAHIIRATIPKGSVTSIETPDLPKGYYCLKAEDIPGKNLMSVFSEEMPLLCSKEVLYKGEPLAVICGPDENEVIKLCRNTKMNYETDYSILGFENYQESQIAGIKKFNKGSVESKFLNPYQTVEGEYKTSIQALPLTYPMGAIAQVRSGNLQITTVTQWPFHVQETAAAACGFPKRQAQVKIEPYHYSYDEKMVLPSVYSALAAVLALKTGKQVRIVVEPDEMLQFNGRRPPVRITRKSALNDLGKIIAEDVEIDIDLGAYPLFTDEILSQLILGAASVYSITNLRITARAIRTSSPPMNLFKGCGIGLGTFSAETHFSRIAVLLQANPVELRMNYLPKKNLKLPTGGVIKQISPGNILLKAAKNSDFTRKYSAYEVIKKRQDGKLEKAESLRGIGLALAYSGNGFTRKKELGESYSVSVKLDQTDKLYITGSCNSFTPGKIWREIAAGMLGIDIQSIELVKGDTWTLPNSGPSFLSSDLSIMTGLMEKCCTGIKKSRFQKPLPLEEKRSLKSPGKDIWDPVKLKGMPFHTLSWGAAVVEIELDPVFLRPIIRGVWAVLDVGRIFDVEAARAAVESEIYEALSWAGGGIEFLRPAVPHTELEAIEKEKLPEINIEFIKDSRKTAGGVAKIPDTIIPSAFIQALSQATGVYIDTLPITPEVIYKYQEGP